MGCQISVVGRTTCEYFSTAMQIGFIFSKRTLEEGELDEEQAPGVHIATCLTFSFEIEREGNRCRLHWMGYIDLPPIHGGAAASSTLPPPPKEEVHILVSITQQCWYKYKLK